MFHDWNEALPRSQNDFQGVNVVPSNQMTAALSVDSTWDALETAFAASQDEDVEAIFCGPKAHSTLALAMVSLESDLDATKLPPEKPLQSTSQTSSLANPVVPHVTTSQGFPPETYTAISQPPAAISPQTTPEMIDPGTFKASAISNLQSTSSESTFPAPQRSISISEVALQSNDSVQTSCNSQPQLLLMSRIEEIFEYQPVSAHKENKLGANRAGRQPSLAGALQNANPIITDTNYGVHIVSDDTDEETIDEDVSAAKAAPTAQCGKPKGSKPDGSHERSLRKRVRAEQVTNISWVQPEYEEKLLHKLRSAFYQHESC